MKARAHIYVSGQVQGVWFRSCTQEMAERMGVCGWVRNLPDGRVEAVFEGDKDEVEVMVDFCRRGPPGAQVDDVEVKWEPYKGEFSGFGIRYG